MTSRETGFASTQALGNGVAVGGRYSGAQWTFQASQIAEVAYILRPTAYAHRHPFQDRGRWSSVDDRVKPLNFLVVTPPEIQTAREPLLADASVVNYCEGDSYLVGYSADTMQGILSFDVSAGMTIDRQITFFERILGRRDSRGLQKLLRQNGGFSTAMAHIMAATVVTAAKDAFSTKLQDPKVASLTTSEDHHHDTVVEKKVSVLSGDFEIGVVGLAAHHLFCHECPAAR